MQEKKQKPWQKEYDQLNDTAHILNLGYELHAIKTVILKILDKAIL